MEPAKPWLLCLCLGVFARWHELGCGWNRWQCQDLECGHGLKYSYHRVQLWASWQHPFCGVLSSWHFAGHWCSRRWSQHLEQPDRRIEAPDAGACARRPATAKWCFCSSLFCRTCASSTWCSVEPEKESESDDRAHQRSAFCVFHPSLALDKMSAPRSLILTG